MKSRLLPALLIVLAGAAVLLLFATGTVGSSGDRGKSAALAAARTQMVWSRGPRVTHEERLQIRNLPGALRRWLSPSVASDVNVPDLIRRFGGSRAVDLVIVAGTYNSLPPDEGVPITGGIPVIVDAHTHKVLLLTD